MLRKELPPADYPHPSRWVILALATWGGAGYLPAAPGTWGAAAALPLWWLLAHLGPLGYTVGYAVLVAVGVAVAGPAQRLLGRADHPAIVIDEAAGLLLALAGVPSHWTWALTGFALFRAFDILKPWPIRWLSRGNGGLEVVVDDVAAGIMARLCLEIIMLLGRGA